MSALTAMKLNEQIVSMRKAVGKARVRLCRRLIRQMKVFKKSKIEKKVRKVNRLTEEIILCKKMPRDDISKFALINEKTIDVLLANKNISLDERVLYKLACQETIVKSVNEFRSKYSNWQHEVPFLLQRLGLQYKSKRDAKKILREQKHKAMNKIDAKSTDLEAQKKEVSALVKKAIKIALRKEENIEKKKKKLKKSIEVTEPEGKSAPVLDLPKPELPKAVVTKGQAVIKVLHLEGDPNRPTSSPSQETEDVEISKNSNDDESINIDFENSVITGSSSSEKVKKALKRRKDSRLVVGKKRTKVKIQKCSGNVTSSKEVKKSIVGNREGENLHPSWIAKKREREALEELKASAKAKKIVFDSD